MENGHINKFPDLEYEIESESGNFKQGSSFLRKIKVFNQDYITNNVQMLTGKAKPIYILGEENKKIIDEIETDEKELEKKKIIVNKTKTFLEEQENQRNNKFTDIARIISSNTSGEATRKYDKREAEEAFAKLSNKMLLKKTEIDKDNLTLRQLEKATIIEIVKPEFRFRDKNFYLNNILKNVINYASSLCVKTVESTIIDRLKQNSDISKWVEEGLSLHNVHKSTICEFCNQVLQKSRTNELVKYFNEADKKLKEEIEKLLKDLRIIYSLINSIKPIDKANLYEEMQNEYNLQVIKFDKEKKVLLEQIANLGNKLKDKETKTTESIQLRFKADASTLSGLIDKINILIKNHNKKTNNFKTEKETSQKELEKHYLSIIYDEIIQLDTKLKELKEEIMQESKKMIKLKLKIDENKNKISSSHKACKSINEGLKTFLGRDEITFEVAANGYSIKRGNNIADNLSEGEKTAIAFVYFTVHLKDKDFNIKEGILVIDDPVSSLDSNSLFQAFAFLKNSVQDAKQIFILTHNFDFLRLLLNWTKNIRNSIGQKGYFMIKNKDSQNGRIAFISELDKTLQDHESEYHYLFKLLYMFKSDGTIASVYHIPNIARKALETFLMFRVPNNEKYYRKLESLKDKFDENKLTAIYKFTNNESHITGKGFDPSLVLETQKNVKYLLDMIKTTFPEHYKILENSIK